MSGREGGREGGHRDVCGKRGGLRSESTKTATRCEALGSDRRESVWWVRAFVGCLLASLARWVGTSAVGRPQRAWETMDGGVAVVVLW